MNEQILIIMICLNEYLPLKQGLRHFFMNLALHHFLALNEYLPLKQGLRLKNRFV